MKELINKITGVLGFRIIKVKKYSGSLLKERLSRHLHIGYLYEDEAFEAIQVISSNTMLTYEPLVSLYEHAVYCEKNDLPGDYVECGTWKGGATGMMALANLKFGKQRRRIHLFDAFEEICQPDESLDDKVLVEEAKKLSKIEKFNDKLEPLTGIYDSVGGPGTLTENKKLLEETIGYPADKLHYHVGWFQDTVPADAHMIEKIAILRLDGDWHASTKICLDHLFDKVIKGGIVIIDDYGYNTGCKKAVDDFLEQHKVYPVLSVVGGYCRFFIKP